MIKKHPRKKIAILLSLAMILILHCLSLSNSFSASIHAYIKILGNNTKAAYSDVGVGETRSDLYASAQTGSNIKTASWTCTNNAILSVTSKGSGVLLRGLKEGTAEARVKITTTVGDTGSDSCLISVYTPVNHSAGYVNTNTDLRRGSSDKTLIRSTAAIGQALTVTGISSDYYRVQLPDDYSFGDKVTDQIAYIKRDHVTVPATDISIAPKTISLYVNDQINLKVTPIPYFAEKKIASWSSSDTKIATVDPVGGITAKQPGKATITAAYSGTTQEDVCTVNVGMKKPTAETNYVGFRDAVLKWNPVVGANGYEIERYDSEKKKYVSLKSIAGSAVTSWTDKSLKAGVNYQYRMRAVFSAPTGNTYSEYHKITLIKSGNLSCSLKTDKNIKLKWTDVKGADGYIVYQYNPKKKKYLSIKTISSGNTVSLNVKKLKSSSYYRFRVRPYIRINSKKVHCSISDTLRIRTSDKTDGYFNEKVNWTKQWSGIKLTNNRASNRAMNDYTINNHKPFVKYNYAARKKTVYIHVYVKFLGSGKDDKFELYKWNGKYGKSVKYAYKKRLKATYAKVAARGLKKYWNINVRGTSYDFDKGVNFKTRVILHTNDIKGQRYSRITIGDKSSAGKSNGAFWHFSSSYYYDKAPEYSFASDKQIHLATQYQTAITNKKLKKYGYVSPEDSLEAYKNIVGHELGHNLGLRDGYKVGNMYRTVLTKEVGPISYANGKKDVRNIMNGTRKVRANANDIEMAFQAQGMAIKGKSKSYQCYKTYKEKGRQFYKSPVIRLKK